MQWEQNEATYRNNKEFNSNNEVKKRRRNEARIKSSKAAF